VKGMKEESGGKKVDLLILSQWKDLGIGVM